MKDSYIKTPRTLAECDFRVGHIDRKPVLTLDQMGEKVVAYAIAFGAGFVFAVMVFA